jgi:carbonic anhydrase/acetyltransferase-like protein (isoleucine patch superfamily)
MPVMDFEHHSPRISPSAYIAPDATIIGQVSIDADAVVMFGAVVRGDRDAIVVGAGSNLQDCVVIHGDPGAPTFIGKDVSVGHGAVVHGATVHDCVLVGMNATVLSGSIIGEGSIIAAGAVVLENNVIPPNSLVAGVPGVVRRETTESERAHIRANATTYRTLAQSYREQQPR